MHTPIAENPESDSGVAEENAQRNLRLLMQSIPVRLANREDKLLTRFQNHKGNPTTKLRALYDEIDAIYSFVNRFAACKKGCNHCCHIPVSVSEVEIQLIEAETKHRRLRGRPQSSVPSKSPDPCPFLSDGVCSIYASRPFVCRTHVAMTDTPYWCEVTRCNSVELSRPGFSEIQKSFELIRVHSGHREVSDIRSVFGPGDE